MINSNKIIIRTAKDGKDWIGIKTSSEKEGLTEVIVPRYYMPDMEKNIVDLSKDERKMLKTLVRAWKKYQHRIKTKNNGEMPSEGINYDFDAAFNLVQDFLEYGLYIELEKVEIKNVCGKIDFPKTIKKCSPILLDEGPLYLPYITRVKKISDESLVRDTQILVLNDIAEKIGWLIGFNIRIPQTGIKEGISKSLVVRLKMIKNGSYNTRKIKLIDDLIKYISIFETLGSDGDELFVSVVYKFWEDMISQVIGNVDKSTLEKTFYIRHRYKHKTTGTLYKMPRELNPLMPDSVYVDNKHITILDAKYYDKRYLPENDDITKQFAYMRKAYGHYGNTFKYRNIFVLPTDGHWHYSNRVAVFDPDIAAVNDLIPIEVLYLNVQEVVNCYNSSTNISKSVL